jgi:hypothetical protein
MGKIALSQNMLLDGVIQLDGFIQSPGPTDVPFKYTGWELDDFDAGPEGGRFNYQEALRHTFATFALRAGISRRVDVERACRCRYGERNHPVSRQKT